MTPVLSGGPPICGFCDDEYEPDDHPDYQGFCSYSCMLDARAVERGRR